ncbi:hypothetical protein ACXOLB_03965 [Streptococcus thermophilus]|nr:hypothetical protein [Streptococcus thermophilus]
MSAFFMLNYFTLSALSATFSVALSTFSLTSLALSAALSEKYSAST